MDKEFLISYLKERNYWWQTKNVKPSDKGIPRSGYLDKIQESDKLERIICLSGIRRSGKTTILYQYIEHLLKTMQPERIVYVRIDDLIGRIDSIHDILNTYHVLTGIDPSREKVYLLLDEIHVLKEWRSQLKYYIDAHATCRFIISGSSKTLLYLDSSESLAGRIRFIDVFPLTFREFLEFNNITLAEMSPQKPGMDSFEDIEKAYYSVIAHKQIILHFLGQYFDTGGYPEWFKVRDLTQWHRTIVEDYFALILFKDIVSVFKVKDPLLLEKMVRDIAAISTNRFTYKGLSERLDVDRETLKLYLYYLQSSMMVFVAEVYAPSKKAAEKLAKKLYFWEEGLRRALTLDRDDGKAAENIVAWHLIKKGHESKPFFEPYYWKNKYEVDFVYDDSLKVIPVEVKYKEQSTNADMKGLIEFMEIKDLNLGIVVTKDIFKREEFRGFSILFIPIWLFLLIV
ncbi:putative ATPase (AAA+ superfamily) [Candidatus Methanoperedens nitroreducens]|uniref:Putative ATPase (AAA+ superfamily) n=1 Tax=Candidatus Methanoperedens nitratireducens TaxID=1392998 RepID=A0A062V6G3_9EURY|nr:ATP-binding protein [Candidatus Methanoperedens nitroreducens]KCZ72183.1 putative ATPase (AAA+ superfamily) [Candidatus Methanoperedens nitroreducens]MDJ1421840.1 ATP-binding protein [Candidatus Methanoperedens sp.]